MESDNGGCNDESVPSNEYRPITPAGSSRVPAASYDEPENDTLISASIPELSKGVKSGIRKNSISPSVSSGSRQDSPHSKHTDSPLLTGRASLTVDDERNSSRRSESFNAAVSPSPINLDLYNGNEADNPDEDGGFRDHTAGSRSGSRELIAMQQLERSQEDRGNGNLNSDDDTLPPSYSQVSAAGFTIASLKPRRNVDVEMMPMSEPHYENASNVDENNEHAQDTPDFADDRGRPSQDDIEFWQQCCPCCGEDVHEGLAGLCVTCFTDNSTGQSFWRRNATKIIVACVVLLGLIVFISLMPVSFKYINYYEMALLRTKSTGKVDKTETYYDGCYVIGPDKEFVKYPVTAHFEHFNTTVYTKSRLEVGIVFSLQYFIRGSEAGLLYQDLAGNYRDVIGKVALNALKNAAVDYSLDEYRVKRNMLQKVFHEAVKKVLEGDCCPSCCPGRCSNVTLCSSCNTSPKCSQGYHVDVKYFQLLKLTIPTGIAKSLMNLALLSVKAEREYFYQNYTVTLKIIDAEVQLIENAANEIIAAANANGSLIRTLAENRAERIKTQAEVVAWRSMCTDLNVTQEDHKMSVYLIRTLSNMNNLYRFPDHGKITGWA